MIDDEHCFPWTIACFIVEVYVSLRDFLYFCAQLSPIEVAFGHKLEHKSPAPMDHHPRPDLLGNASAGFLELKSLRNKESKFLTPSAGRKILLLTGGIDR
jgi:hypothetical protein